MTEKNELPTEKKIEEAREKGQVAKSEEITTGVQLAVILLYFWFQGPKILQTFEDLIAAAINVINLPLQVATGQLEKELITAAVQILIPMGIFLIISTVASVVAQVGVLLSPEAVKPSIEKISVLKNAKELFSLKSLFNFGKSCFKVTVLSITFYFLLKTHLKSFQYLALCDVSCGLRVMGQFVVWMWATLVGFYVVIGTVDWFFQKRSLTKQLMMSKDEIKKEYKNSEGDPEVKNKRREIHREIQSGSLESRVKRSSVVVRNPTHIAVCIRYEAGETPLPQIVEKGTGEKAKQIVEFAERNQIPMVEEVFVARSLNKTANVGDYIPAELFAPVAEILRLVADLQDSQGKSRAEDVSDEI